MVTSLFGVCSPPFSWEPALLVFSPPSHPLIPSGLCQVLVTQKPLHPSGQGSYPADCAGGGVLPLVGCSGCSRPLRAMTVYEVPWSPCLSTTVAGIGVLVTAHTPALGKLFV